VSLQADVRSLDQLESLAEQTASFRSHLLAELENLQLEVQRLTQWIEVEATDYWRRERTLAEREFTEAAESLSRCQSYVREEERRPCTEEKKRLQRAKERRALCEEQLQVAKGAAAAWERARQRIRSKLQRCRDLSESELNAASIQLRNQIDRLRQYANLRSSGTPAAKANEGSNAPNAPQNTLPDSERQKP
jgi:hypothetical protein